VKSGLSPRAFAVEWLLKDDGDISAAGISPMNLALAVEALLGEFPNASVNSEEGRKFRAALYRPLLALEKDFRGRCVNRIIAILFDGGNIDEY